MLEVMAALFTITVILSMVISNVIGRINQAKYERTVNELSAIAHASIDYLVSKGSCPALTPIDQMVPEFMVKAVTSSPFGTSYQNPACGNNMVTVSVFIPKNIAKNIPQGQFLIIDQQAAQNLDLIQITQTIKNEYTSHLDYCLNPKNVCW